GGEPLGRREEAFALRQLLDRAVARERLVVSLANGDVEGRGLDVVEVADLARTQLLLRARPDHQLAELDSDVRRYLNDVAGKARYLGPVRGQVRTHDLVEVDHLDALLDCLLDLADEPGAEDRLHDDGVVL